MNDRVTARQVEVLNLLAGGLSNKQIATRMNITEHTVKEHVTRLLRTLGANNRAQAAVMWVTCGTWNTNREDQT